MRHVIEEKAVDSSGKKIGKESVEVENEGEHSLELDRSFIQPDYDYDSLSLEDFEIVKTIGTGSFARVMLAQVEPTGELTALKILSLYDIIKQKQVEHVKNEKEILLKIEHPFIVTLKWYSHDEFNIYMLFEYVCGGELFSYLRRARNFSSSTSAFYAAEIVSALEYLHDLNIVYRDLKPENLLLDSEGHLKIADFGFAKQLTDKTWTLCGTPEYLAPEVIQNVGHDRAVDWWALGVLIYEMLVGYAPFYQEDSLSTYEKILAGKVEWEQPVDGNAKDLVVKLLTVDRTKRIGNLKSGAKDVKGHRWFKDVDWDEVLQRKLQPPIIPKADCEGSNYDDYTEEETWIMKRITKAEEELFADF